MVILWKMCYVDVLASCFLILKCLSAIGNAGKYNFAIGCVSKNVACVAVDEEHCIVDCLGNVLWQFIHDVINTFCCTSALIGHKHFIRLDIFLQREISCLYSGTVVFLFRCPVLEVNDMWFGTYVFYVNLHHIMWISQQVHYHDDSVWYL